MNEPSHNVFCLSWNDLIESKRMFFCSWFCFVIGSWVWPGFKYLVRIQWEIQQNKWSLVLESPISDASVTDVSMPHGHSTSDSHRIYCRSYHDPPSIPNARTKRWHEGDDRSTVRSKIGVFLFLKQTRQNVKQSYHLRWRTSDKIESENGGTQIGVNDSKCNLCWHRYGHKWELYIIISRLYNNHIACSLSFDLSYENLNKEVKYKSKKPAMLFKFLFGDDLNIETISKCQMLFSETPLSPLQMRNAILQPPTKNPKFYRKSYPIYPTTPTFCHRPCGFYLSRQRFTDQKFERWTEKPGVPVARVEEWTYSQLKSSLNNRNVSL